MSAASETLMLDAALEYIAHGLAVFPVCGTRDGRCACGNPECDKIGKHPLGDLVPHGLLDATTDAAQVRAWWTAEPTANIGLPTGAGFFVVDIDPRHGGDETLRALEAELGPLPETAEVLTGGGGRHLYFAPVPGLRNSTAKLGPGIDTRGAGGYVLAPPSSHHSGRPYTDEVEHALFETSLAVLPEAWVRRLRAPVAMTGAAANGAGGDWAALLAGVEKGSRHADAARLAGHYLGKRLAPAEVERVVVDFAGRCTPPLDPDEARTIVRDLAAKDAAVLPPTPAGEWPPYIEPLAAFLAEADPPERWIFPDLLPHGVIMLMHGEPRARKSLVAFELALAAATGTAPFGLARFRPAAPLRVLYIQEEDPRALTRPRLRRLVTERCGPAIPETLHVSVRRGVDLDTPAWVTRLIADCQRFEIQLLVLDAARRLSAKTDEGPATVRELVAVLRALVTEADLALAIVHHDIKPPVTGQDIRRRSQRASGGDWFAACECPVHVERVNETESLVFPQDYKFSADPAPFTFECGLDGRLIKALIGTDSTPEHAETAGPRGRLLAWLETHGPANKSTLRKAGFGWRDLPGMLDTLERGRRIDSTPGKTARSVLYFVPKPQIPEVGDDSTR